MQVPTNLDDICEDLTDLFNELIGEGYAVTLHAGNDPITEEVGVFAFCSPFTSPPRVSFHMVPQSALPGPSDEKGHE